MKSLIASLFVAALLAAPAFAQEAPQKTAVVVGGPAAMGERVEIGNRDGTAAAFGRTVVIGGSVDGDSFAAGQQIDVTGAVGGDLRAMGERINLSGSVDGEASLTGQEIDVAGRVGRELHAAGERVRLSSSVQVGEDARLAGQDVEARGTIAGDLAAAGETVLIDAVVQGDVDVRARSFSVGPNARIAGKLDWRAAEQPVIDPAAQVTGGVQGSIRDWSEHRWRGDVSPEEWRSFAHASKIAFSISAGLTALIIGAIAALAFPAFFDRAATGLRERPLPAFGWGLLLFFGWPVLATLLLITIIGIPLGLLMFPLYALVLIAGYALGAAAFGALAVRAPTTGGRIAALALGVVVIGALAFIPWIGGAIGLVVTLLGLGLWVVAARRPTPTITVPPQAASA